MEADMHIAIARFPAVPAHRETDFRNWFSWSNDQMRETAGLKARRLLGAPDGSYTALVEHESAGTFAAMHATEPAARIHERLSRILNDGPQATTYDVVLDFSGASACCGGGAGGCSDTPDLAL
jgi:hypothetical protein